jgi:hypothetical protein
VGGPTLWLGVAARRQKAGKDGMRLASGLVLAPAYKVEMFRAVLKPHARHSAYEFMFFRHSAPHQRGVTWL